MEVGPGNFGTMRSVQSADSAFRAQLWSLCERGEETVVEAAAEEAEASQPALYKIE